jgi:hypothetical protein
MGVAVQTVSLNNSAEALAWLSQMKGREPQDLISDVIPVLREIALSPRPAYTQLGILETLRFPLLQAAAGLLSPCSFRAVPLTENEVEEVRPVIDMMRTLRDAYFCLFNLAPVDLVHVANNSYSSSDFRRDPTLRDRLAGFSSQVKPISAKLLVAQRMISAQAFYLEFCFRLRLMIPDVEWGLLLQYAKQAKQADLLEDGVFDPMSPEHRVNGRMALVTTLLLRLARPESLLSSSFELVRKICRRFALTVKFRLEEAEAADKPSHWPSVATPLLTARLDTRALLEEVKNLGPEIASGSFSPTLLVDTRFLAASTSRTITALLHSWRVPVPAGTVWRKPVNTDIRVVAGYHAMAGIMARPVLIFNPAATQKHNVYVYRRYDADTTPRVNNEDPNLQRLRLLADSAERWQVEAESMTGFKCVRRLHHPRIQLEQLCCMIMGHEASQQVINLGYIDSLSQSLPAVESTEKALQQIQIRSLHGTPSLVSIKPIGGTFEDVFMLRVMRNGTRPGDTGGQQLDFEESSLILPLARYQQGMINDMLLDGSLHRVQIGSQLFRGYDFDQVSFKLL